MYLSHLYIRNFRNFSELDLELTPTTVIVGENKVGKSNLIYALRLVLDPSLPDSMRHLHAEDFWDGLGQPFAGNKIEVSVKISDFEKDKKTQAVLCDCLINKSPMVAKLTYIFRPRKGITTKTTVENDYEFVIYGGENEKHQVGSSIRQDISLVLLPALRDAEAELQTWRRSPLRPLLERLKIDDNRIKEILKQLENATEKLLREKPMEELAKSITNQIVDMVGEFHGIDAHFGFASTRPDQLLKSVRLLIDGEKSRSLSEASLGTANVLYLALLLQELKNQEEKNERVKTIISIEEPEAHLHPHIQRLVFRYFLGKNTPLIVTTHSPHIASVTPLKSITLLRTTAEQGSKIFTINQLGLTGIEIADLQRYLDVTRAEVLFAKGVILVEGSAELFLIPAFAESMIHNLDQLGITLCSVHGTDFLPYRKLLSQNGLNIPHVAITDGDPQNINGKIQMAGLIRGYKILDSELKEKVKESLSENNFIHARKLLTKANIFVGEVTLEADLLGSFSDAFIEAYRELNTSTMAQGKFEAAIQRAKEQKADGTEEMLSRIVQIGKGRFAQRLADKVKGREPPQYIKAAINRIVSLVKTENA